MLEFGWGRKGTIIRVQSSKMLFRMLYQGVINEYKKRTTSLERVSDMCLQLWIVRTISRELSLIEEYHLFKERVHFTYIPKYSCTACASISEVEAGAMMILLSPSS